MLHGVIHLPGFSRESRVLCVECKAETACAWRMPGHAFSGSHGNLLLSSLSIYVIMLQVHRLLTLETNSCGITER